ncbi:hypothetical protein LWF15_14895 [Kineosporia rhizophila]|uniref:hypothetical protein n=1 Tax=Kineosporia TaxID=49184 RepID=UPI000A6F920D|nr:MULTISPECIES: hypothetical protein [Kineosporia]MCE0536793.1 hypothetical protein [Kineosporia rhizophila]GLY13058.1 hypothetical protein Kisp01_00740 [Kineosporia sp. NBRC 101677]
MANDEDVEVFLDFAATMMNINALGRDWETEFVEAVSRVRIPERRESFRRGFAKSLTGRLTPEEFERHTDWDFDTDEEFRQELTVLWRRFYGDADPRDSLT